MSEFPINYLSACIYINNINRLKVKNIDMFFSSKACRSPHASFSYKKYTLTFLFGRKGVNGLIMDYIISKLNMKVYVYFWYTFG